MADKYAELPLDGPDDETANADDFPSPSPASPIQFSKAAEAEAAQAIHAAAAAAAVAAQNGQAAAGPSHVSSLGPHQSSASVDVYRTSYVPYTQSVNSALSNSEQIAILREAYARNPNPSKEEYEALSEKTGRPWSKIREYFRQRRHKLRGLEGMESMQEPGRASGWLQIAYRVAPQTSSVSQLNMYNSYRQRFDPYSHASPLLGGQELVQLACATFPGCEMAKDDGDYVLKGLKEKETGQQGGQAFTSGIDGLVEPLRAGSWLLNNFQQGESSTAVTQTDLYASYATRFSRPPPDASDTDELGDASMTQGSLPGQQANASQAPATQDLQDLEHLAAVTAGAQTANEGGQANQTAMAQDEPDDDGKAYTPIGEGSASQSIDRLLNPVELISLARMTFPKCQPAVDAEGRFIISGLAKREGVEKRAPAVKSGDMFPFAPTSSPEVSDPVRPFASLLKRKISLLQSEPPDSPRKRRSTLSEEDRQLVEGLRKFRDSELGKEVRDVCVHQ